MSTAKTVPEKSLARRPLPVRKEAALPHRLVETATKEAVVFYKRIHPLEVARPKAQTEWRHMKASERSRSCDECILGYAAMDVIGPPTQFRLLKLNDRPLDNKAVQSLFQSLKEDCLRFHQENMFPVIATRKMIDVERLTSDKHADHNLPPLTLTKDFQAAAGTEYIFSLGGQHRLAALKLYIEYRQKELKRVKEAIKRFEAIDGRDEAEEKRLEELLSEREKVEEEVGMGGEWGIVVYDADQLTDGLMYHLSENKTTITYNKTAGEKFMDAATVLLTKVQECEEMKDEQQAKKSLDNTVKAINAGRSHVSSVFQMEASRSVILYFVRHRDHFRTMEAMDWTWMNEHFCDVVGGLTGELWNWNVRLFQALFRPVATYPSYADTKKIIDIRMRKGKLNEHQLKDWATITDDMRSPVYTGEAQTQMITPDFLDALDSSFEQAFNSTNKLRLAGSTSEDAILSWSEYFTHVDSDIKQYIPFERMGRTDEEKAVARNIRARMVVLLNWSLLDGKPSTPLPTKSVFVWMVTTLEGMKETLKEVSRWFDLLVDYNLGVSRSNSHHDYTAAMFNILNTAEIFSKLPPTHDNDNPPTRLSTKVALYLWEQRLRLLPQCEAYLLESTFAIDRPVTTSSLNRLYPKAKAASRNSKKNVKSRRKGKKQAEDGGDTNINSEGDVEEEENFAAVMNAPDAADISAFRQLLLTELQVSNSTEAATSLLVKMKEVSKVAKYGCSPSPDDIAGLGVAIHTGWPWNRDPKSSSRIASLITQCALIERATINSYRAKILAKPEMSLLRASLKSVIDKFLASSMELDGAEATPTSFSWPDRCNNVPTDELEVFDTDEDYLDLLEYCRRVEGQVTQIRRGLQTIQKLDVSHLSATVGMKHRVLANEVGGTLDALQEALEFNAARQRYRESVGETELFFGQERKVVTYSRMPREADPHTVATPQRKGLGSLSDDDNGDISLDPLSIAAKPTGAESPSIQATATGTMDHLTGTPLSPLTSVPPSSLPEEARMDVDNSPLAESSVAARRQSLRKRRSAPPSEAGTDQHSRQRKRRKQSAPLVEHDSE